jgi:hypothetical protein
MRLSRQLLIAASILLSVLLLSASIRAQQQATQPPAGTNRCGAVDCPAGCDCQLTICDKSVQPDCVDVGVCVNCPSSSGMTARNVVVGGVAVALIAVVAMVVYRRRRQVSQQ